MNVRIIDKADITALENLLIKDGKLQVLPYDVLSRFSQNQIALFCLKHACYQVVNTELVAYLRSTFDLSNAIEIGAGNGWLGSALGIRMTDNKMQQWPHVMQHYAMMRQPVIAYGKEVETIDANSAVIKYSPDVVIGAWVTQKWYNGYRDGCVDGIDERLFKGKIKQYIVIGNEATHDSKEILKMFPYKKVKHHWLLSRSMEKEKNCIYIFDCQ